MKTATIANGILEVFCDFTIQSAHHVGSFPEDHPCHRVHGHTYHIRVYVGGECPIDRGFLISYEDIKLAVEKVLVNLDHHNLNDVLGENATCEMLAIYLLGQLSSTLPGLSRIKINETGKAGVEAKMPQSKQALLPILNSR